MANILVIYGDKNFANSKWLIRRQARKLGIFDRVVSYSPDDMPLAVKASPLQVTTRAAGYIWKPMVVWDAMRRAALGDIIYYVDCGSRLQPSPEWGKFAELMQTHDGIFFNYRSDYDYHWDRWGHNSVKIKHWAKPATLDYFRPYFPDDSYLDLESLWAGFFIVKKTEHTLWLDDWLHLALLRPDLFAEPLGIEKESLPDTYCAHRHDQAILTFLVNYYKDKENLLILPETSDSDMQHAAVASARYRVGHLSLLQTLKFRLYHLRQLRKMKKISRENLAD